MTDRDALVALVYPILYPAVDYVCEDAEAAATAAADAILAAGWRAPRTEGWDDHAQTVLMSYGPDDDD